ncbi:MAG: hypothetical protein FVQ79_13820 [Planctomycetes bacterium]|nr:hypothetical protein [Planctomycetota bacterium]
MLRKGKRRTVVRRNGHVYSDRVCTVCGNGHWHCEKMCIACRNEQQKKRRGVIYIKRKEHPWYSQRQERFNEHAERIEREMKAIEAAGLSPTADSIEAIENAGVELEGIDVTKLMEGFINE